MVAGACLAVSTARIDEALETVAGLQVTGWCCNRAVIASEALRALLPYGVTERARGWTNGGGGGRRTADTSLTRRVAGEVLSPT